MALQGVLGREGHFLVCMQWRYASGNAFAVFAQISNYQIGVKHMIFADNDITPSISRDSAE